MVYTYVNSIDGSSGSKEVYLLTSLCIHHLFGVLACSKPMPVKNASSLVLEQTESCDLSQGWDGCLGKTIRVTGTTPTMIYSHPILSSPSGIDSVQSYIDVGEKQLIVLSEETWECHENVSLSGVLKEIHLGGPEGTRGSYRNFYISQSSVQCIP